MYIYQRLDWPAFSWDEKLIDDLLMQVVHKQGKVMGKMEGLGFEKQEQAVLEVLTKEVIKSADIEGEHLNTDEVRSSVARHLGIDLGGTLPVDRHVDGIVEMLLDATQNFAKQLTIERLCHWHALLFPSSFSGMTLINPGALRNDSDGSMQVVSGSYGREKVHFRAPSANKLLAELTGFVDWFNDKQPTIPPLVKAGIAHLWLVTLHPFDDGNGRISRAVTDMALAKAENLASRFYSMSAQIRKQRKAYYDILEKTQKGGLDITIWLHWFLECLHAAMIQSEDVLKHILNKAKFWDRHVSASINERQKIMLNLFFDGFKGKVTSGKWAKIMKCSQDTAARDINQLLEQKILQKGTAGGRSTHYMLVDFPIHEID